MDVAGIFEVLAARNLAETFRKAISHVVSIVSRDYCPQKLGKFLQSFMDEIILLLDFFLNLYHLRYFRASWAEKYAHLVRQSPSNTLLSRSLLDLAVCPYIFRRLEKLYLRLRDHCHPENTTQLRFVALYPYIRYVASLLNVYILIRFLLRKLPNPGLLLYLLNIRLHRRTAADPPDVPVASSGVEKILHSGFRGFGMVLTICGFVARFWRQYGEEVKNAKIFIPPPPKLSDIRMPLRPGMCPVCGERFQDPVAVRPSGIVFCKACITRFVETYGVCPVTNAPLDLSAFVPIYF